MTSTRVAVVTGANKGIGYAIVRGICKQFDGQVYLTARHEELGKKAVASLKEEGLVAIFHQLDVTDKASIDRLRDFIKKEHGGLDILVNNAGIAMKPNSTEVYPAKDTVATNFTGQVDVCDRLFPLLRPHARVVNMSSILSRRAITKCSRDIQRKLLHPDLNMDQLRTLMQEFVKASEAGIHTSWPKDSYSISKVGLTVMTFIQSRHLKKDPRPGIIVNCDIKSNQGGKCFYCCEEKDAICSRCSGCCPGYVSTDMTFFQGTKTVEEGADTPLYLAFLPRLTTTPSGEFVSDRKVKAWGVPANKL